MKIYEWILVGLAVQFPLGVAVWAVFSLGAEHARALRRTMKEDGR
jgi:hypothetical protein